MEFLNIMKSNIAACAMVCVAFIAGTIASTMLAGCNEPSKPVAVKAPAGKTLQVDPIAPTPEATPGEVTPEPGKTEPEKTEPDKTTNDNPTSEPAVKAEVKPAPAAGTATIAKKPRAPRPEVDKSNWKAKPGDYPQWMRTAERNNVVDAMNIPSNWNVGGFDRKTGAWKKDKAKNIKWVVPLGSQTYGNPVVAAGKVFVGTNNYSGYVDRFSSKVDLGCLICFNEADGQFLWQHSSEKLPTGLVHDWPLMGICCAPYVEGDRVWFVTSRGEVRCVDAEGFYDGEDDGPVKNEWIKQFAVEPLVQAGLNDSTVSDVLSAQFELAGAKIGSGATVETVEQDKKWTITYRDGGEEKVLEVRVEGTNVIGSRAANEGGGAMDLFTVDARLIAGLEEGNPSKTLRTQFALSGIDLPPMAESKAATPGKLWTIATTVDGVERQFRLKMVGPRLTCEKLLTPDDKEEADVVWVLDMMKELQVSQHNMCSCSVTAVGDVLYVCTSNGVDESHLNVPAPDAPSFIALDKNTGKLLWSDKSPGANIHHGQWSSPTVAVLGDVPQVLFGGGDGWLYSFRADGGKEGKPELLWKFDTNPKDVKLILGGRGTRNDIIATPVVHDGLVYVAVGQDPEHGEGPGRLWCIDPTKRGDVSQWLAVKRDDPTKPIPYRRVQAVIAEEGEIAIENPNSAAIFQYAEFDRNGNGKFEHDEKMHRSCGTVAIKNGLLFIADFSGLVHCLDAKTGKVHWTHDMLAASWGSPLIVNDKVIIGDEDGDVSIFELKAEKHEPTEINMVNAVYSTPIVANGVLYISNRTHLFAIEAPKTSE